MIDSIPWGPSGAATAKGRTVPTQSSGGGGSTTGGSTGGGGGRSGRPSDDSGGEEGKDWGMSAWQQWWARLLLAGGGVSSVFLLSSRVREALQNAVASVKAQFTPGRYWLVNWMFQCAGKVMFDHTRLCIEFEQHITLLPNPVSLIACVWGSHSVLAQRHCTLY